MHSPRPPTQRPAPWPARSPLSHPVSPDAMPQAPQCPISIAFSFSRPSFAVLASLSFPPDKEGRHFYWDVFLCTNRGCGVYLINAKNIPENGLHFPPGSGNRCRCPKHSQQALPGYVSPPAPYPVVSDSSSCQTLSNFPSCDTVQLTTPEPLALFRVPEPPVVPKWTAFVKSLSDESTYPWINASPMPGSAAAGSPDGGATPGGPNAKGGAWGTPQNEATEVYACPANKWALT
ncbi:hypothetical protein BC830DRAFT_331954 [Chytriomyces sp. MP71]|nr:hypothetical protein BC830DRAFT_331954 [Chytriomyces sp. MP71]